MELREKLIQLRMRAGESRGLGRPMTQVEVTTALRDELGQSLSQAYLSQLERGKRVHLSNTSREALARFFQVHPGYLVSDLPDAGAHLSAPEMLQNIPGLALAPDLIAPGRQRGVTSFAPRERRAGGIEDPVPPRIGDPVPPVSTKISAHPDYSRFYPRATGRPGVRLAVRLRSQLGREDHLQDLLSRLRDHPESERVLVLVEQILHLQPQALAEFEKLGHRLAEETDI
jgi:transcriptional regulator with XRE-family HTH domain